MKSNTFDVYCEGQLEFIQLDAILAPAALTYLRAFQLCCCCSTLFHVHSELSE